MPDGNSAVWSQQDTRDLLAGIAGDLVGLVGLVAVFLIGFALLARLGR